MIWRVHIFVTSIVPIEPGHLFEIHDGSGFPAEELKALPFSLDTGIVLRIEKHR